MPLKISEFLKKDFVYKQNPDGSYMLKADELIKENMNDMVDSIISILEKIYTNIITINKVNTGRIECNDYLLQQALARYSRDIYGEQRLDAKLEYYKKNGRLTQKQKDNLAEYSDYGLKTTSQRPYLHRKVSNFLYWLSILKPFAVHPEDNSIVKPLGVAFEFHNEYICYLLILAVLRACGRKLTIHEKGFIFKDFLYDLHFRNLSRSSLEFFLFTCMTKI